MKLSGQVAIITGGSRGIGSAVAIALAREGADIVIADINISSAFGTIKEVESLGCKAAAVKVDVSNTEEVRSLIDTTVSQFGRIDILVNCAGICQVISTENMTEEIWDRMIDINLKGTYMCCKMAIEIMRKQNYGRIVNFGSIAGEIGGLFVGSNYASSKAAIMCLTKCLAKEFGKNNINVNSVAPGYIATEMTKDFSYDLNTIPLGRLGTAEEVADVVKFLCSHDSRYITGATIDVNGGVLMR